MTIKKDYVRPLDMKHGRIDMNHGAGGRASMQLIEELFGRAFESSCNELIDAFVARARNLYGPA